MSSLPFVSLWSAPASTGEALLHILTRECHKSIPLPTICESQNALEEFLPELALMAPNESSEHRWLLLLEPSLPAAWQILNWEALSFNGQPLSTQALIVRNAVWNPIKPVYKKTAYILNLFPEYEFPFLDYLEPIIQSGALRTCRPRKEALSRQMATCRDLFIVAHGRSNGLVDLEGRLFDIPLAYPMPERIWLLACNVNNALYKDAIRLLENGCTTVIASTSDLSAPEIARLIQELFSGIQLSEECEFLGKITQADKSIPPIGSKYSLTVWGAVNLDQSPSKNWNRLAWNNEHGREIKYPLDDDSTREEFMSVYGLSQDRGTWPLTLKMMLPPLLCLAEKYHHPAMPQITLQIGNTESPEALSSLALAARRLGNYIQMARYLNKALLLSNLPARERAEYLGLLTNLFIEFDLPESARRIIEKHGECLIDNPKEQSEAEFRRLDWLSRIEALEGRLHLALDLMTTKRNRAKPDAGRELAWQLYLSSWGSASGQVPFFSTHNFAIETAKILKNSEPNDLGHGNETTGYLLRALSCYCWMFKETAHLEILRNWLPTSLERLTEEDPGPWAYMIAYLFLLGYASKIDFERSMSALKRANYYIECAIFLYLANQSSESQKIIRQFLRRRKEVINQLGDNPEILHTVQGEMVEKDYFECINKEANAKNLHVFKMIPI